MVILYWKDLVIKSRIKEYAASRGINLKFARNLEELAGLLATEGATRLIVDLSAGPQFAAGFAAILDPKIESLGVIAHVDLDTQKAAQTAGFSEVVPRSFLVKNLDKIIS